MKTRYDKEIKFLGKWVSFGYSFRRFGFGIAAARHYFSIDFLFFWFGIEF